MTEKDVIGLYYYFELLRKTNKEIIKIAGMDCILNMYDAIELFYEVIENITVLLPCLYHYQKDIIELSEDDGILNFIEIFPNIKEDLKKILKENENTMKVLKVIRNKHEHVPHLIYQYGSSSGSEQLIDITFKYNNPREAEKILKVSCEDLIVVIKKLNNIFYNMLEKVLDYLGTYERDESFKMVWEERLYSICFKDYNKIYELDMLREIGKSIL